MRIQDGKLDKKGLADAADVLAEAFANDPLFKAIFKNGRELRMYLTLMLAYFNKSGEVHAACDGGKTVAVSVWNPKDTHFFRIRHMLKSGILGQMLVFLVITRMKSIVRLKHEVLITERHHYKRAHVYLFLIGSVAKGGGGALMEYAVQKFNGCPIYLENSNVEGNMRFYRKFGFHSIKTIDVMGIPVDLLTNSKGD